MAAPQQFLRFTRDLIAKFIKDPQAILQFERLVLIVRRLAQGGTGESVKAAVWMSPRPLSEAADLVASATDAMGENPIGLRTTINDSVADTTTGIGAVITGGGSEVVPAYYDGADWRIG